MCVFVSGVNLPCTIAGLAVGSTWFGPCGSLELDGKALSAADGDAAKLSKAGSGTVGVNNNPEENHSQQSMWQTRRIKKVPESMRSVSHSDADPSIPGCRLALMRGMS